MIIKIILDKSEEKFLNKLEMETNSFPLYAPLAKNHHKELKNLRQINAIFYDSSTNIYTVTLLGTLLQKGHRNFALSDREEIYMVLSPNPQQTVEEKLGESDWIDYWFKIIMIPISICVGLVLAYYFIFKK